MYDIGERVRIVKVTNGEHYVNKTGVVCRLRDSCIYTQETDGFCIAVNMDDKILNKNHDENDSGWWWKPSALIRLSKHKRIGVD